MESMFNECLQNKIQQGLDFLVENSPAKGSLCSQWFRLRAGNNKRYLISFTVQALVFHGFVSYITLLRYCEPRRLNLRTT